MTYFITGASGHIGNNLVRYIREKEKAARIVALTRRRIDRELAGVDCEQIIGNLQDGAFLSSLIEPNACFIHSAGLIDLTDKRAEETFRINYDWTRTVTDVCCEKGARLIYVGSVDGLAHTGESPITEPMKFSPDAVEGNYGKSKAMAMQYIAEVSAAHPDFSAVTVLPSAVIGGHDYKPSAVGGVIRSVLRGGAEFGIRGGYNFVNVRDVCKAIYTLTQNDLRGSFILSGENVSVREMYEAINRKKGYRRRPIILPVWLVRLFLPFVRVLNKITLKALTDPHDYSYAWAARELGYSPTPFEETLDETIAFFENE